MRDSSDQLGVLPKIVGKSSATDMLSTRFRAEDKFILLSSPRVTGPTNYDKDF